MEIIRKIGNHEILIDTSKPVGIYLQEDTLKSYDLINTNTSSEVSINKKTILNILSEGDYLPLTLQWEMTDKCNFACDFCYIVGHMSNKIQHFQDIKHHLEDLIEEGLLFCLLTGGEPTLHPDFKEIYRFLKEHGVIVDIFSNGLNLTNDLVDLFKELPPSSIEVSLYSLNNHTLVHKYGVKDLLPVEKILNNIINLKSQAINIKCKTFINMITYQDIPDIEEWCKKNNIDYYTYSDIKDAYDGTSKKVFEYKKSKNKEQKQEEYICLPCEAKKYGCYINSGFTMSICANIQLSDFTENILELGIKQSLKRLKQFIYKFHDKKIIGDCANNQECATCIAYAIPIRNEKDEIISFSHPK